MGSRAHSKQAREKCFELLHAIPNDAPGRQYIRCIARIDQLVLDEADGPDPFPLDDLTVRDRPAADLAS